MEIVAIRLSKRLEALLYEIENTSIETNFVVQRVYVHATG